MLPVDPWAPNIDSQSLASQLFAFSLFPYIGFLYFITKSKSAPKLTLFGVYFLLAFVGATRLRQQRCIMVLPYLMWMDWLHGGAEALLTLTNLFIVLELRQALRNASDPRKSSSDPVSAIEEEKKSSI
ncbi:hypothetical protein NC653_001073 [Populus alba x Populus x berolinensis]|uniref:Uncharacterized protein n=1 Tax=Populus alba x Populus x berolinensis TaxID=444605 RepID=A0AAD6RLW7_9ROSI|nr:hypothetical protein NC653_001073 [Populus alba x Populus x berolinensis]